VAEPITDRQVVAALRPFVRAAGPVVDTLREADPFGFAARSGQAHADDAPTVRTKLIEGLKSVRVPGSAAWNRMGPRERTTWWIDRVGRATSVLTAVPGLGGALADRLPVQDALGAASQGVLLCALAGERGVTDVGERVRLVAWVLFDRDVDAELAAGREDGHDAAAEDARTEALRAEMKGGGGKAGVRAVARTLWRLGRSLLAVSDELEKRPSGRLYHHALGMLPVVGMVGDYLGERAGLKRVAKRADTWFTAHHREV
jgi:hypothetical protein